ncbi:TetR/AcrR family transcriptional regulator [Oryzobacter terrae]|uniref:TetR/AcrR family transcriptional regulator n=1 Tax=Oryzobacter terrae TaxID=1620385 RepID=UPI0036721DC7
MTGTRTSPDGRSSRWDEHRLTRRAELVEATLRAVREHGAGVGMDEVAAVAGTSKTVFYRHFTDRAGLWTAVAERVDATIVRGLTRAADTPADTPDGPTGRTGGSPGSAAPARGRVRAVIAAYLHLVETDPEVYRFIVTAPLVPPGERPSGDVAAGMTDRIARHVADLVGAGLGGSLDGSSPTPRLWGVAVVGMVRATADAWLAGGGAAGGQSSDELADDLTRLVWDGLGSLAAAPAEG